MNLMITLDDTEMVYGYHRHSLRAKTHRVGNYREVNIDYHRLYVPIGLVLLVVSFSTQAEKCGIE